MRSVSTLALLAALALTVPAQSQTDAPAADDAADVPAATADQGAAGAVDAAPADATAEAGDAAAGGDAGPGAAAVDLAGITLDTVVATVDGTDITVGHVIAARRRLPEEYRETPDDALFAGLVDQLIQQQAVASKAGELSPMAQYMLENERRSLLVAEAIDAHLATAVTDDLVQGAYDRIVETSTPPKEYSAAHILLETEEDAAAVRAELDGGADFAEVARARSTGPSSDNGGDLGWFGQGMMVPEFEAAVMAMEPGQVSDPVQTQFGWHVIRLNETRDQSPPPLEQVRPQILRQVQQTAAQDLITSSTAQAEINRDGVSAVPPAVLSQPLPESE